MFGYVFVALGLLMALVVVQFIYFSVVMVQADQQTNDGQYYGWSREARGRFRARIQRHARILSPLIWLLSRANRSLNLKKVTFQYQGVPGPRGACDAASFARGAKYPPRPEDVFVVTQMKCGTTWMQNLVYQLVNRGDHDLTVTGQALYGLSPWLESRKTLPAEQGPLFGDSRPTRLIKTHFPTSLCPYVSTAKYIYVVRHPVSCFASCVDFLSSNLAGMTPPLEACEEWFCSPELMWWSPWPQHVSGWWQRSREADNVLFIKFEDMRRDFATVAKEVAAFLNLPALDEHEMGNVLEHCSFQWMSDNYDLFEMQVPHLLQNAAGFFKSGSADRHLDVPPEMSARILAWCDDQLQPDGLSVAQWFKAK